ncbi:MAG: translocation/assembly module TamB domain-containing protein [Akkermansiaceae bacterium]
MVSSTPEKPDPDSEKKTRPPKRRNWRKRFVILCTLLLTLGWLLNGPLARWAVHYGIEEAMTSLGMNGDVTVKGSVVSGISLHKLNYRGNEGIESITLTHLDLEYKIRELFEGKIRGLDIKDLNLVIDYAKFPKTAQSEGDGAAELRQSLATLRPYLTAPRIGLSGVQVTLLENGKENAVFKIGDLAHSAESGLYQLTNFQASDANKQQTPIQNTTLTWHTESATVDRLEVLPGISLEEANFDWSNMLRGEASLLVNGAAIHLTLAESLKLDLEKGEIRSAFYNEKFSLDLPFEFVIDSLDADISLWDKNVPLWQVNGAISLKSLSVDEYNVQNASINFEQKNSKYDIKINGSINKSYINATVKGEWVNLAIEEWWGDTRMQYTIEGNKLATLAASWIPQDKIIDLDATTLIASGSIEFKQLALIGATAKGSSTGTQVKEAAIPSLSFDGSYQQDGNVSLSAYLGAENSPQVNVTGVYSLETDNYEGSLEINEAEPAWLNSIASVFDAPVSVSEPVHLTWSGEGNIDLEKPQKGELKIRKLTFSTPKTPQIQATGNAVYEWPKSIHVSNLEIRESDWLAKTNILWDGKMLNIEKTSLSKKGDSVLNLAGTSPLTPETLSTADFFNQKQSWKLRINSDPIAIKKLDSWFQLDLTKDLAGNVSVDLNITGSPAEPIINGQAKVMNLTGLDASQRDPLGALLTFRSEDKRLYVTSNISEGSNQRLNGTFVLPFEPTELINNPNTLSKWLTAAKLEGDATINSLALERFSRFIPGLKKIEGTVSGTAKLSGTLGDPDYSVQIEANAPLIKLRESDIGDIRDVRLIATIDETQKVSTQITAQINGGKFEVKGTTDLTDPENPGIDLSLVTRYALIHRDDLISVRANADLQIKGTLTDAIISGKIGVVESIIYKDMELIPIGVPSSEVAKVQLPALDAEKAANGLPVPAPFDGWKLNVTVDTTDPILIRGNIASGQVNGSLKIGGTLSNPEPNGKLIAKDVTAKLPFSILKVKRGEIRFTPADGLDPTLSVRGKSTVGAHDVSVFVYGKASSPKTTLTSFPPLPETEIMTLLATGTTTSGLEDRDVATFKAFQIFLMKLKKRTDNPNGNQLFRKLLDGVDDLNINVGEKDRFTGRKFSSATIELSKHWHFTAQVDAQQQTRGLIVYVLRFR